MPHPQEATEPLQAPPPLELAGRPASYRLRRITAWAILPIAAGGVSYEGFLTWWLVYRFGGSTFGTAVCGGLTAIWGLLMVYMSLRQLWEMHTLDRLRLQIGPAGISRLNRRPWHLPWQEIRHIAITNGKRGKRRLLVDDGNGTPLSRADLRFGPAAHAEWMFALRRYVLDVPVDAFDADTTQIIAAIRHFTSGRLPDLLPPPPAPPPREW